MAEPCTDDSTDDSPRTTDRSPAISSRPARSRRRLLILLGAPLLAFALVVGLSVALPHDVAGAARPVGAAAMGEQALAELRELDELAVSGRVELGRGSGLSLTAVTDAEGTVNAHVTDSGGGSAHYVAAEGTVKVRANRQWWLNQLPGYTMAGTGVWLKAHDDMGLPLAVLHALSGRGLADTVLSAGEPRFWTSRPAIGDGGMPALALTTESGATVYVSRDAPTGDVRLLGIAGPISGGGGGASGAPGRQPAPPSATGGYPYVDLSTSKATPSAARDSAKELSETAPEAKEAAEPPAIAGSPASFVVTAGTWPPCVDIPVCSAPMTVTNVGGEAGEGTVLLSSSNGASTSAPVSLAPGGSTVVPFSVPNTAPAGGSVMINITGIVQVTSRMGKNTEVPKRLGERGIDVNNPVGAPSVYGPEVLRVLDDLTRGTDTENLSANASAARTVRTASEAGVLGPVHRLVTSPGVAGPADSADHNVSRVVDALSGDAPSATDPAKAAAVHLLERAAALAAERTEPKDKGTVVLADPAELTVEGADGKEVTGSYRADLLDTAQKRAYGIEAVPAPALDLLPRSPARAGELLRAVQRGVEKLTGGTGNKAPPGYAKVVEVYLEPAGDGLQSATLGQLTHLLGTAEVEGSTLRDVVLDEQGKPVIDELVLVNDASAGAEPGGANPDGYSLSAEALAALAAPEPPPASADPAEATVTTGEQGTTAAPLPRRPADRHQPHPELTEQEFADLEAYQLRLRAENQELFDLLRMDPDTGYSTSPRTDAEVDVALGLLTDGAIGGPLERPRPNTSGDFVTIGERNRVATTYELKGVVTRYPKWIKKTSRPFPGGYHASPAKFEAKIRQILAVGDVPVIDTTYADQAALDDLMRRITANNWTDDIVFYP
ncbi:hypothetical protein [Prauserella marina]|nr:hypothetical protein [Prauserella marina]